MTEVEEPPQTPTQLRNSVGHLRSYIICLFLTNPSRKLESSLFSSDDGFFGLLGAPFYFWQSKTTFWSKCEWGKDQKVNLREGLSQFND